MDFLFAYIAGLLTLINPCVLPLLPIILAGSVARHRLAPVATALGLATSFAIVGFLVTAFAHQIGLNADAITRFGAALMIGFGLILLVPQFDRQFARVTAGLAARGNNQISAQSSQHLGGHFFTGMLLGAAWSPCIGPTLGGAIGLASQGESLLYAFFIMVMFSFGAGTIVLALSYGSRELIGQRKAFLAQISSYAKPIMGAALLAAGLAIWFHLDRQIEFWLLEILPNWMVDLSVRL